MIMAWTMEKVVIGSQVLYSLKIDSVIYFYYLGMENENEGS